MLMKRAPPLYRGERERLRRSDAGAEHDDSGSIAKAAELPSFLAVVAAPVCEIANDIRACGFFARAGTHVDATGSTGLNV
jgi:hypothetical protein